MRKAPLECRTTQDSFVIVLAALLAGAAMGCSALFVNRPPPREKRGRVVDCTSSNVAPIIDALIAGWQIVRIAVALSASDAKYDGAPITRRQDIALGGGALTVFGISSAYGFVSTAECRQ